MFILRKGHQPGIYVPLRALFLVNNLFPKIIVGQNALECELFYFHFRFLRFRDSEKLPPWNGK